MRSFVFESMPARVVFAENAIEHLPREIEQLGARRALVLSTPQQEALATDISRRLGQRSVGVYPHAVMHVPIEVARKARDEAVRLGADCVVAVGGGSTVGLGKAIALESGLRSEEHTSELQSPCNLVCRLLLEKKKRLFESSDTLTH